MRDRWLTVGSAPNFSSDSDSVGLPSGKVEHVHPIGRQRQFQQRAREGMTPAPPPRRSNATKHPGGASVRRSIPSTSRTNQWL